MKLYCYYWQFRPKSLEKRSGRHAVTKYISLLHRDPQTSLCGGFLLPPILVLLPRHQNIIHKE